VHGHGGRAFNRYDPCIGRSKARLSANFRIHPFLTLRLGGIPQPPNLMPCASGNSGEKFTVTVWRRM
jgi:hypothetical protein